MKLLSSGLIINGDPYYSPKISLCPFSFISRREFHQINKSGLDLIGDLLSGQKWSFVESGKYAISIILNELSLDKDDEIWIITSTGNRYVSKCVTDEIAKICNWSMKKSDKTKAIYIIHEFGRDSRELVNEFAGLGIPIIEDAAYGLLTALMANWTFGQADYSIFSFPKAFEMQAGGILIGGRNHKEEIDSSLIQSVARSATNWVVDYNDISLVRQNNHKSLSQRIVELGLSPSYTFNSKEVPGVFMFDVPETINLNEMKIFFNSHGCESTVFYGRYAYMVPVHQNIGSEQIDYFIDLLSSFISNANVT